MPRLSKRNKTYRQDSDIATAVETAARIAQVPEADIVDECIRRQIAPVLRMLMVRRDATQHKLVATALAELGKQTKAAKR